MELILPGRPFSTRDSTAEGRARMELRIGDSLLPCRARTLRPAGCGRLLMGGPHGPLVHSLRTLCTVYVHLTSKHTYGSRRSVSFFRTCGFEKSRRVVVMREATGPVQSED